MPPDCRRLNAPPPFGAEPLLGVPSAMFRRRAGLPQTSQVSAGG